MEVEIGATYKHSKKGGLYKVIAIAKHSETLEDLVIYEALYENTLAKIWARPISNFIEEVEIGGKMKNRFEKVGYYGADN